MISFNLTKQTYHFSYYLNSLSTCLWLIFIYLFCGCKAEILKDEINQVPAYLANSILHFKNFTTF